MAVLQMTWQPTQKRKSGPPLGLKNLGNTCYLNSVLQCLTYTPPLANFCLKSQHSSSCDSAAGAASEKKSECPFCILEKRIVRSLSLDCTLDTPSKINNCLKIFAQHFRYGRQEDAHEFLRYVIDSCHNTCLRLKKLQQQIRKGGGGGGGDGNGNTIVKEIFGGALQSQIKCLSCGAESNKVDDIMDISLDVLNSSSLKDALQKFFQPEVLDGSNKYKCDNCKKLVAARKQLSILQAPNVLVIQLKRFEGIYGGKIDKPIAFEEVLVLSSYMCKASQDLHPEYNLFGTIVHSGFSPDSGHYYAYIKDAVGRWYCCNDSYVSLSTLQEVLSEKVYILFFSRTKQRSPPAKTCFPVIGSKPNNSNGLARSKNSTGQLEKPENGKQLSSHSHNNSNGLAKNSSGQLEKPENGKHVSSHPPDKENSMMSKVNKVHSSPVRDLSVFGKSSIKKTPTSGNIKIVLHPRESGNGTGDVRASIPKEKEAASSRDRNGVSKSCHDGEMTSSHAIANGNGKIPSTATRSVDEGLHKDHGGSNGKAAGSDHKEMSRSYSLANGNGKIPSVTTDSLGGSLHRSDGETNGKADARTSVVKDLSNDRVESSPISGSKRKSPYQCILLDQDARSREKMEEFKEELQKEASLVLRSCGWSEEVYASMRSKKRGSKAEDEGSNYHDKKRLLIADAKATFISRIPETLKGSLIKRLRSFSQGNLPSSS